jgi:hypothetical protein
VRWDQGVGDGAEHRGLRVGEADRVQQPAEPGAAGLEVAAALPRLEGGRGAP